MSETWKRWQDWVTLVVGVLLFISPFAFGAMAGSPVAWVAYVGGVLLVIAALLNLSNPAVQWPEWAEVVIGVLLFIAPWALAIAAMTNIAWSFWIAGILAVVLAGWVLLGERTSHRLAVQH